MVGIRRLPKLVPPKEFMAQLEVQPGACVTRPSGLSRENPISFWSACNEKDIAGHSRRAAEMRRGKVTQALCRHSASRKIKPAQRAFDPHVHRKRGVEAVGKQRHAIGDLRADAARSHPNHRARFGLRQAARLFQIEFPVGNLPRGGDARGNPSCRRGGRLRSHVRSRRRKGEL